MRDGFIKVAAGTPEIKVADCAFNAACTINLMKQADKLGVRLLVLPELGLTGYTCGDLFLQPVLLDGAREALNSVRKASAKMDMLVIVGLPVQVRGKLYNCAAVICHGEILGLVPKTHLPNYGEFYEKRWFSPAPEQSDYYSGFGDDVIPFSSKLLFSCAQLPDFSVAVEICEDLWAVNPPSVSHAVAGAMIIANLSASDEIIGKDSYRRSLVTGQSARLVCGYLYADAGEGESTTDMVFAAHNMVAENGTLLAESERFATNALTVSEIDVSRLAGERRRMTTYPSVNDQGYLNIEFSMPIHETMLTRPVSAKPFIPDELDTRQRCCADILSIQTMGLKKRIAHSRAKTAVVGISGGLDSALALLAAVRASDLLQRPRTDVVAVTMPCFGTTARTKSNAEKLSELLGVTLLHVDITASVRQHFADIGHPEEKTDVTFENAQARERTQVLMDIANKTGGIVVGTGDLSELALGWATYNGDHMSMYGVNASIPKTLVRYLVDYEAKRLGGELKTVLMDILDTPVSPELLPPKEGEIEQKTEDLVGPYELHDFFIYYGIRWSFPPEKVLRLAEYAFAGEHSHETILAWLNVFYRRFFQQQFKRSCLPDGPKVGSVSLSPRGDWRMPSDAVADLWLKRLETL